MEHIYRVRQGADTFLASETGSTLRRLTLRNGDLFGGFDRGAVVEGGLQSVTTLAPVVPRKIICVGLNYKDHAAEVGKKLPPEPLLFFKPTTAVIDPGAAIRLPPSVGRVDHEAELAVVIGRRAHRVSSGSAWDYVFGITCLNDVTARDIQNRETQYTRCKSFDTFAPIGPCIATEFDGGPRQVEGWVNAECRQRSNTRELIFPIEHLIEYITLVMTLEPGDVISTGTPSGIGRLEHGDTVTVKVEGVGELSNPVQAE
jgi:2-keto-4-pentenoate hydratase/2-oxohepta-3-ene-1,7-dioic acid hydratase in catechol pathway